jgi:hypothetical protein
LRTVHKRSVSVKVECRYAIHLELRRGAVMRIYVQSYESYPARVGKSQFIQNRRQPLAVASVRGIKLQQHRAAEAQYLPPEHVV